jgi:glycosyltransferase involved in cell wall biosynthesis
MKPSISVTFSAYNAARYLKEAIESVLAQTYQPYEVIVVDDGSTDNTREVCEAFGPKVTYIYQQNDGTLGAGARAHAMRKATGEWIAIMDHDDRWLPNKLEKQVKALEKCPDARAVFTRFCAIDGESRLVGTPEPASGEIIAMDAHTALHILLRENPYCPASALVRRDFIEEHGVTDPQIVGCADWDLWLSIVRERHSIILVDEYLTEYRIFEEQYCTDKSRLADALKRTLEPQADQMFPGCDECREAFEAGREHVSYVYAVAARALLDRYHSAATAGKVGEALPHLWSALKASPQEVLRPKRLVALSKNGALGAMRGIAGKNRG